MSFQNDEKLPFFVYGTLRPGQRNYYLLQSYTLRAEPALANGLRLYSLGSYPMVLIDDSPSTPIQGDLITPKPENYASVLQRLDELEEYIPTNPYQSFYWRVKWDVILRDDRVIRAWLYVGNPRRMKREWHRLIPGGDWCEYVRQNAAQVRKK